MDDESLMIILKRYEEKLKEYMTPEEFSEFTTQVAKESFFSELTRLPDGAFKDFAIDNFQHITGSNEDFIKWMMESQEGEQDDE